MPEHNSVQNVGMTSDEQIRTILRRHIQRAYDGRFDHTERQAVRDAADQLVATFLPLSSAGVSA